MGKSGSGFESDVKPCFLKAIEIYYFEIYFFLRIILLNLFYEIFFEYLLDKTV